MNSMDASQVAVEAPAAWLAGARDPGLLRDEVLADLFRASAARRGDKVLFRSGARRVTWAEADRLTDRIAARLAALGARPGRVVGLWMPRGIDLLMAQIAIVKSGAAFLPFDADAPTDRIATCLADAGGLLLLADEAGTHKAMETGLALAAFETLADAAPMAETAPLPAAPDDPAYLIYTSGSTGVPKGIVISNRNICHFLRAGNAVYGIREDDVVFQSASVAFDLSMEEIWTPYLVGATLLVATPEILADLERLPKLLADEGVTVIDTVPTLLSVIPNDIPGLRLILLGGEALAPALVERWARPGRRILNTYGPTEATVVATVDEVAPGRPVTIGRPIPNYTCYIVDEALRLVPPGQEGELLIGGPGVAAGYLQRPELTAEKFIANPFGGDGKDPVLYRSGDAVSLDAEGRIVFHGRIDDQVKIRGFRVELGEIEAALADCDDVLQAAVVLRHDAGMDRLVAFLVPEPESVVVPTILREELRRRLPPYMIPERFETVAALPRLTSGKTDRKALKAMPLAEMPVAANDEEPPATETEALLLVAARKVMPGRAIAFDADFFLDLGGHSLIAAQFVSLIREVPAFSGITLQDVYQLRTLRKIGAMLDARFGHADAPPPDLSFAPPSRARRIACALAQLAAMPVILSISTLQWLGVFLAFMFVSAENLSLGRTVLILCTTYVGIKFGTLALVVALKWLVLGRTKPGRYPLWGVYFFRWWFVQRLNALVHPSYLANSPIMRLYLRLMGARVGSGVMIAHAEFGSADLVEIGAGASIGHKANIANSEVIAGELVIGRVRIGPDAYIGNQSIIPLGCEIGADARIEDMTALAEHQVVGECEIWDGSPARRVGMVDRATLPEKSLPSPFWRHAQYWVYGLLILAFSAIGLIPLFPAFFLMDKVEALLVDSVSWLEWYHVLPVVTWIMGAALVVFTLAFVIAIRWLLLPMRVKPGTYSVNSWFYLRQWMVNLATEVSLDTLSSLYATIYMRGWYRLMGCRIGKGAEISTNIGARYDLVSIGEGSFMADECVLGDEDNHRGWVTFRETAIGNRVFVGNNAVIAHGTRIEEGALVGVKSRAPDSGLVGPGETWFGSPPIKFPVRQTFGDIGANWTYEPPLRMKLWRAAFEALHTTFPTMLFLTLGSIAVYFFIYPAYEKGLWLSALGAFVAASMVMPVVMVLCVCAIKWGLMGVYKPLAKPMWSWWAMKTEAVAVLYWGLGGKVLLEHLRGTAYLPMFLRLFGARIGEGVYMDTTDITEFDCVRIGNHVAMNDLSCLQTHLYEDRVMKVGRIEVADGVSIGSFATVLYDTKVGAFARLTPLTLVMKGEQIPAHTVWGGAPAVPAGAAP
ncbi:Pls/PosA family non-ribosomal peptide synthetase [Rhabdaerophilum calidifontis]|uniref:Pls/PosA family non-ribosomal peptide synthetase n=1 Tax=Rhabdaerophilum calidifontis TaxID=2604328 RepID=UPI00123969D5|nr:Pls/PosA family non-ribosomal peptide synthetase [Rhabdaerophilum calidifontis]